MGTHCTYRIYFAALWFLQGGLLEWAAGNHTFN